MSESLPTHLPDCTTVTDERLAAACDVTPEPSDANARFLSAVCRELQAYRNTNPNKFVTHNAALSTPSQGEKAELPPETPAPVPTAEGDTEAPATKRKDRSGRGL